MHTVYVISLASQITSALVLAILAWEDRRSRWLVSLAVACGLHAAAIYVMPLWRDAGLWLPRALSLSNLIGMFYLTHLGLRALVLPGEPRSARTHAAVGAAMLLVFGIARFPEAWCVQIAVSVTVRVIAGSVHRRGTARAPALRLPLRITALLLIAIMVTFLVRLPMESMVPAPPIFLSLRKATMLLVTLLAFSFLALYAAESRRRLHEESRLDVLTGLPNRRALEEGAAQQIRLARTDGRPCVLLMLDLDHFKRINDTWGHNLGDRALRATSEVLLRACEEVGACTLGRMGGEEFAMVSSGLSIAAAHTFAEQLREAIAALRLNEGEREISFTASLGVSALKPGENDWSAMLQRADSALYRAKHGGRNRVVLCRQALQAALGEGTPELSATTASAADRLL